MNPRRISQLLAAIVGAACAVAVQAADISGAGATFPYPIYSKWADAYKRQTGIGLNYQSIGSGGGIKQIKAKTVTFGASDMPLKPEDLKEAGLVQFPMIIGGVVPVVNLKGVQPGQMVLTGELVASIYLGEIARWNDPRIQELNPRLALPATTIAPVYRSDGSGTNFLFSHYLSQVSPKFKEQIGEATSVQWPAGIGAKGNEGVAGNVAQTSGAIGYVEYAYATQNNMIYTRMINADGKTVSPDLKTFAASSAHASWSTDDNFFLIITNQPGDESWPIAGATWVLMRKDADKTQNEKVLKYFSWCLHSGQSQAEKLVYVPLPANVVTLIEKYWKADLGIAASANRHQNFH